MKRYELRSSQQVGPPCAAATSPSPSEHMGTTMSLHQKGIRVTHCQNHPLLRKIASRRRRLGGAGGRPQYLDLPDHLLTLDRKRFSTLLGERILTARETEVLYHLARGETDRQIADKLFVSRRTVSNHVSHILDKLAVTNRRDAVRTAFRISLI